MQVAIVGGGICGLTLALKLKGTRHWLPRVRTLSVDDIKPKVRAA